MALLTAQGFNSEEIPVLAPSFKGFVLSKQFDFSNIDHAQWAGIMHPAATFQSPLIQLIAFIFDLPNASYEIFHILIMTVYFTCMILGAFGFYLFLKYAAKIPVLFAIFGGIVFCFSGAPLLMQTFTSDGGIFLPAQICFPYALLFISLAFEYKSNRLAAFAGLALATPFFLLTPHPEGTIYSVLFFGIYTIGLWFSSRIIPFKTARPARFNFWG